MIIISSPLVSFHWFKKKEKWILNRIQTDFTLESTFATFESFQYNLETFSLSNRQLTTFSFPKKEKIHLESKNKITNRIVERKTWARNFRKLSQTSWNADTQPNRCFAFIRRIKDEDGGMWCYPSNSIKLLIRQLPSDNVGTNEITKTWQTIWAALPVLYNFVIVAGGSCRIKAQRREPVHRSQSKINSAMPRDSSSTPPVSVGSRDQRSTVGGE